jgi:uncharacterized damage-inducible protein DinB
MMQQAQIAKHFQEVYFGGNWTTSHLQGALTHTTWQHATEQVATFNSIATLVYHIHYYVVAVAKVLQGGQLAASDKLSFQHRPINSQHDWDSFLAEVWAEARSFATLIENMPEEKLWQDFPGGTYGNYYRNLHGIVEHAHYHLGQIVLLSRLQGAG